ncbi:L-threonine aldolase [Stappia sp. 22II-S9-Z10]|nr:L-threonine aldolase [Stappia sp. 22II-S9-Z10]
MSIFGSDNWAGASDRVMATLSEANAGAAPAYGNDIWTRRAKDALAAFFEREVSAFFVATGSGANALALAVYSRPGGAVLCHPDAHIARDEAGAPILFAPQMIEGVDGPRGLIDPDRLARRLNDYAAGNVNDGRPAAVSLTNANELGQCYTPDEVARIADLAKTAGAAVHMDGARFMNALAFLGVSAADLTWRAGVDTLSLGLTKVGAWCAEVVVQFDGDRAEDTRYRQKQAAMLISKNRFAAAQVCALLEDDHALALARHSNAMAVRLADAFAAAGIGLGFTPQANEVFAWLPGETAARLKAAGVSFAPWNDMRSAFVPSGPEGAGLYRFVTSFRTTAEDIAALAVALGTNAPAGA